MFVYLNQLRSGDIICIDVANIREFYPEEVEIEEGVPARGTLLILYRGDPWIVQQSCSEVLEACNKAKRGGF